MATPFLFVISLCCLVSGQTEFQSLAWQTFAKSPDYTYTWPEEQFTDVMNRPNIAISLSGGGSRAYTAGLGYLAGLHQLGLLKNFRYLAGISGGGWAVSSYTYYKFGHQSWAAKDDTTLLGPIVFPSNITMDNLWDMDPGCIRKSSTTNFYQSFSDFTLLPSDHIWERAVHQMYLKPCGIGFNDTATWNAKTLSSILSRNPSLSASQFVLPSDSTRPYPILGIAMMGPSDLQPFQINNGSYSMMEATALYVGDPFVRPMEYNGANGKKATYVIGGQIEHFAYGGVGTQTLPPDAENGLLTIAHDSTPLSLARMVGATSLIMAGGLSAIKPFSSIAQAILLTMPYFSPSYASRGQPIPNMVYGDGGLMANPPLISLLRRRVKHLVLFSTSSVPLAPLTKWNPFVTPPTPSLIDDDIPPFFGIVLNRGPGYDLTHDQVFSKDTFPVLVNALQVAQATGRGAVATLEMTTIENTRWGIAAGLKFNVTWVYLSRCSQWEASLPSEVQKYVIPEVNPQDPSSLPTRGPFLNFPNYDTSAQLQLTIPQSNLLADLTGWIVLQHADLFRSIVAQNS